MEKLDSPQIRKVGYVSIAEWGIGPKAIAELNLLSKNEEGHVVEMYKAPDGIWMKVAQYVYYRLPKAAAADASALHLELTDHRIYALLEGRTDAEGKLITRQIPFTSPVGPHRRNANKGIEGASATELERGLALKSLAELALMKQSEVGYVTGAFEHWDWQYFEIAQHKHYQLSTDMTIFSPIPPDLYAAKKKDPESLQVPIKEEPFREPIIDQSTAQPRRG